jgi:fatty acid desaturase
LHKRIFPGRAEIAIVDTLTLSRHNSTLPAEGSHSRDRHAGEEIARAFKPHWVSRAAFPLVTAVLALTEAALFFAVRHAIYWLAVPLTLVASHLMHGSLIGLHEASHGMLRKKRWHNEFDGIMIGMLGFTSFSLYRWSHQTHHAHLGTPRDEEFWPFVDPTTPRWLRVSVAFVELFFGLLYSPLLFLRTFLRKDSPIRSPKVRRRIWAEFALLGVFWTTLLSVTAWLGGWKYLLWMYLAPAFIAANLQSWRKYVEHVGLTGSTVKSTTRSVVADDWWGKLVSLTLLHEPFHGVHHQRVSVPHAQLPGYVAELEPTTEEELEPFPSYTHAFKHLIRSLADPKVGPQWNGPRNE